MDLVHDYTKCLHVPFFNIGRSSGEIRKKKHWRMTYLGGRNPFSPDFRGVLPVLKRGESAIFFVLTSATSLQSFSV